MKHAIGFDKSKVTGTKNRIMHAYRNYFCCGENYTEDWYSLVELELATKRIHQMDKTMVYFHLTIKGLEFLARLCGFKTILKLIK